MTLQIEDLQRLSDYARQASIALMKLSGGGSEMFNRIGEEFYADPELCVRRAEEKRDTIRRLAAAKERRTLLSSNMIPVPREELQNFADVVGNLIGELPDPGTDALAAQHRIRALLSASPSDNAPTLESVWAQARDNHERYSATGSGEDDLRFLTLGLVGEAGELANFVKKRWRDGDQHEQAIRYECADVFAYNIMVADQLGLTPETLIATVAEKQRVFVEKMLARPAPPETREKE